MKRIGDELVIRIDDAAASPATVAAAVAAHGVRAAVDTAPVGPSRVGEILTGAAVIVDGNDPTSSSTVRVPSDAGAVALSLGRLANADESYAAPSDAFAEDEPLECSGLWGEPIPVALPALRAAASQVEFTDGGGHSLDPGHPPTRFVADALMYGPDRLIVVVADEPRSPFLRPRSVGSNRCPVGAAR